MSKAAGFLNVAHEAPAERPPQERVHDWQPIYLQTPEGQLTRQATRCMDCGIPFCHTGKIVNGLTSGCPINNLIPDWNDLVYQGLWREAYDRLSKTNNFPEFTGHVCPAPCEAACTLGISDPPVTIKSIEAAIVDKAFNAGWVAPQTPARRTGKRVAVVGSGPAGLACAEQLNLVGHQVTVFERDDRPGGLLMYGIPNMKLDKGVVLRRITLMMNAGIAFRTGVAVGEDVTVEEVRAEFDALVLCTGATRPRDLAADGRHLAGVHFAMDFLRPSTKSLLDSGHADGRFISAAGRDVVVIGGGDTGTDCVATALRHGCRSLVQLEIMPQPPDKRAPDNPWPQWPNIYKLDYGQKEAQALHGADPRQYLVMTQCFVDDGQGSVAGLETVRIRWEETAGSNGRPGRRPVPIPGTERHWPAQLVLLAMGYLGPEGALPAALGVAVDGRSNIAAEYGLFATNVPGVFAAGDARRGQSLVVWAIAEGRGAARECDRYLMGATDLP